MAQLNVCMETWLPSGPVFTSPSHAAELCISNEGQPVAMSTCARQYEVLVPRSKQIQGLPLPLII